MLREKNRGGPNGNRTRVPDVRDQRYSLSITHDCSNSAIFFIRVYRIFTSFHCFNKLPVKNRTVPTVRIGVFTVEKGLLQVRKNSGRVEPATY